MVLSVIALTDRVLPGMRSRGWGRIPDEAKPKRDGRPVETITAESTATIPEDYASVVAFLGVAIPAARHPM